MFRSRWCFYCCAHAQYSCCSFPIVPSWFLFIYVWMLFCHWLTLTRAKCFFNCPLNLPFSRTNVSCRDVSLRTPADVHQSRAVHQTLIEIAVFSYCYEALMVRSALGLEFGRRTQSQFKDWRDNCAAFVVCLFWILSFCPNVFAAFTNRPHVPIVPVS